MKIGILTAAAFAFSANPMAHADEPIEFSAPNSKIDSLKAIGVAPGKSASTPGGSQGDSAPNFQPGGPSGLNTPAVSDTVRLKKLLEQRRNWIFSDPAAFGKSDSKSNDGGKFGFNDEAPKFDGEEGETLSLIQSYIRRRNESEKGDENTLKDSDDESDTLWLSNGDSEGTSPIGSSDRSPFDTLLENRESFNFDAPEGTGPISSWNSVFDSPSATRSDEFSIDIFDAEKLNRLADDRSFSNKMFSDTSFLSPHNSELSPLNKVQSFEKLIGGQSSVNRLIGIADPINTAVDTSKNPLNPTSPLARSSSTQIEFSKTGSTSPVGAAFGSASAAGLFKMPTANGSTGGIFNQPAAQQSGLDVAPTVGRGLFQRPAVMKQLPRGF
jgi:hypothetical protein